MKRLCVGAAAAAIAIGSGTAAFAQASISPAEQHRQDVILWNNVVKWNNVVLWNNVVKWNNVVLWNNVVKWNAAVAAAKAAAPAAPAASGPHGACGGDLPPCYVMMRESGGSLTARNPSSTASGKWQFLDSTWANYGGYPRAYLAPESVQDGRAREVWNGGAGCSAWSAC